MPLVFLGHLILALYICEKVDTLSLCSSLLRLRRSMHPDYVQQLQHAAANTGLRLMYSFSTLLEAVAFAYTLQQLPQPLPLHRGPRRGHVVRSRRFARSSAERVGAERRWAGGLDLSGERQTFGGAPPHAEFASQE